MANYPKPHFVLGNGKWKACYGNQCKGSKYRVQLVIAEGETPFAAHCKYLEILDPQKKKAFGELGLSSVDEVFEESHRVVMAEFTRIGKKVLPVILALAAGILIGVLHGAG